MQIILQEDVEKLGTRGQLVHVAEGYARNFLFPKKLALEATPGNLKRLDKMRAAFAKKEATEKEVAQKLAVLLAGVSRALRSFPSTVRTEVFHCRREFHSVPVIDAGSSSGTIDAPRN
jgi:ribosomal protein L9